MRKEVIINLIKNFGPQDMSFVAMLIMRKAWGVGPINVDGPGDGGQDVIFTSCEKNDTQAVQITAQGKGWQGKIKADLRKINKLRHIDCFTVFVKHELFDKDKRKVSSEIWSEFKTHCNLYGARELASLIVEHGLVGDFCSEIIYNSGGKSRNVEQNGALKALYAYYSLSEDSKNFTKEIINSAILYIVSEYGEISQPDLVNSVMRLLLLDESRAEEVESRIVGLLSTDKLSKKHERVITLSPETKTEVDLSSEAYNRALLRFGSFCDEIIQEYAGIRVGELSYKIALTVAKCYVQQQIESAKNALIEVRMSGLSGSFVSAYDELRATLLQSNIPDKVTDVVADKILSAAAGSEIVNQLTAAVLYVGLRGTPTARSSIILNVDSWTKVDLNLDSSVAIPIMATYLYGTTTTRFSKISKKFLSRMQSLGVNMYIPSSYLNECASHLMAATRYCFEFHDLDDEFANSHNGFVEHYFQLRKARVPGVPATLREYLSSFSPAVFYAMQPEQIRLQVESDIANILTDCGVHERNCTMVLARDKIKVISEEYAHRLQEKSSERTVHQERHDVQVMTMLDALGRENKNSQILATWDRILIAVTNKLRLWFWAVNPAECYDLVQGQTRFSDVELLAIGNALSRIKGRKDELAGKIIDRIVWLCNDKLNNADYRRKVLAIKNEVCARCEAIGYDKSFGEFEQQMFKYDSTLQNNPLMDADVL